ncbi:MAG: YceI family protein [Cyclobacteriaceae bacterium]
MKIKYFSFYASIVAVSLCFSSCNTGSKSTEYDTESATEVVESEPPALSGDLTIDTENSMVKWKGEMMGMYAHEGTLKFSEGTITMAEGQVTGGSFVVDMASMIPTDENFDPEKDQTKEKLLGHLSSPDFFDVENNPTASFSLSDNTGKGVLTIRGKEGEESVDNIVMITEGDQVTVTGTLKFDRKNYDVAFDHPMQEMVISDDVELDIELIASK